MTFSTLRNANVSIIHIDQHHPRADYLKGLWHEFGKAGFATDKREAFRCYKRAATKGYARASYRLGMQYEFTNEHAKALQHYRAGESRGDAASCYVRQRCANTKRKQRLKISHSVWAWWLC